MARPFHDRADAGRVLSTKLTAYAHHPQVQVLALPRGGVPVAFEVAQALRTPLDVSIKTAASAAQIPSRPGEGAQRPPAR
jgi:putative phosphoribosyl transferase